VNARRSCVNVCNTSHSIFPVVGCLYVRVGWTDRPDCAGALVVGVVVVVVVVVVEVEVVEGNRGSSSMSLP